MPESRKSTGGKSRRGRPRKTASGRPITNPEKESPTKERKSVRASSQNSSKEHEVKEVKSPILYFTIRNCLLCETSLSMHKIPWNETLQKRFESLCTFLNLELDERHSWDFKQENFPFCPDCLDIMNYLHTLYNRLEKLHTNVALGVRKIRKIVMRTKAAEGKEVSNEKFENPLKSSKSLEYRVKFVRAQIMTAMNDNGSDDEDIILPRLDTESNTESVQVQVEPDCEGNMPKSNNTVAATNTPRFEIIPIKVDQEEGETENMYVSASSNKTSVTEKEVKNFLDAETQYDSSDITIEETELGNEVEAESGKSDETGQDFFSCNEVDDEPVDEFQAFLEEQLEKRRRAAMQAEMLASRLAGKQSESEEMVIDNTEEGNASPVDKQFDSSETDVVDLGEPGTMDFFEEKPEIIELNSDDVVSHVPRRSVRPKKKAKYNKEEYMLNSDEDDNDEDFDINNQMKGEESDSDFETRKAHEKRSNRQRKRTHVLKSSDIGIKERLPDLLPIAPTTPGKTEDRNSWLVSVRDVVNSMDSPAPICLDELFADQVRALKDTKL